MKILSSWDDYSIYNMHLANMLKRYGIPAIFFIDLGTDKVDRDNRIEQIRSIAAMGFEIGCHTYSHPQDLKLLSDMDLVHEITHCRGFLQGITEQEINWFCYPRGRYDERVKEIVRRAEFKFARTTSVKIPETFDPLAVHTSFHCYQRKEYDGKDWLKYGIDWIKFLKKRFKKGSDAQEVHFWGHAHEIEKYGEWAKLEELFKWIHDNCIVQKLR